MTKIDILPMMRKFYGSANSILCHSKYMSELTKLSLFESFALPVLMYGLAWAAPAGGQGVQLPPVRG